MASYETVTLHLPTGYFIRNLRLMAVASEKFQGLRVQQGTVTGIMVTGFPESAESAEVALWARQNLRSPHAIIL